MEVRRVPFPALRLGATLGSGATGDVFIGELGGAPVAVKRLRLAAIPNARAELSRRFRAEVDVLSRYAHPRLVRLLGWAEEEDPLAPHPLRLCWSCWRRARWATGCAAPRASHLSGLDRAARP